jgi:hypothetical protein
MLLKERLEWELVYHGAAEGGLGVVLGPGVAPL